VRSLLLWEEGAASIYETDTRDFEDPTISELKDELQQVYFDHHEQAALGQFMPHVRRVRRHSDCSTCLHRSNCCGAFFVSSESPFEQEERWIEKHLAQLRGRVLDVGCGQLRYLDIFRSLIEGGDIEYHGLDPDRDALEKLENLRFPGLLHHGTIEEFSSEPSSFDHVIALRSVNHFRDIREAFRVMSNMLKSQGKIVVCDSLAFAMLRTPAQVRHADESARVGHEHYRNWTSHQVIESWKRLPLRVDYHHPVTFQTSNQWIVLGTRFDDDSVLVESGKSGSVQ
jgi:SAM-dependent methyltransferase